MKNLCVCVYDKQFYFIFYFESIISSQPEAFSREWDTHKRRYRKKAFICSHSFYFHVLLLLSLALIVLFDNLCNYHWYKFFARDICCSNINSLPLFSLSRSLLQYFRAGIKIGIANEIGILAHTSSVLRGGEHREFKKTILMLSGINCCRSFFQALKSN